MSIDWARVEGAFSGVASPTPPLPPPLLFAPSWDLTDTLQRLVARHGEPWGAEEQERLWGELGAHIGVPLALRMELANTLFLNPNTRQNGLRRGEELATMRARPLSTLQQRARGKAREWEREKLAGAGGVFI